MGVFSFFYGLPPGYFDSFEGLQQPALLVSEAQRQGYQMGLYTSADMYRPVTLDRTAFASVPNLRVTPENPQDPAWKRDEDMTREWIAWLGAADRNQPFFGFLFYDTPNAVDPPESHQSGFESPQGHPMPDRLRRYRQSIHYADALVGEVLADLEARGLADRTVVLVTSDHGEEFQESGPEFSIHGSGYSRWQLGVPLFIAWPGMEPGEITTRSSHYDVAPTLLKRLLGCDNAPDTVSVGQDLFTRSDWPWLIAGSYFNYAVVEPDQVTVTYPNGAYEVRDAEYRIAPDPQLRAEVLQGVMEQNRRFHR
jgi:hypothetical protein